MIPDVENELSKKSPPMCIHSMYDNKNWGKKSKPKNKKVVVKSTDDRGVIYGSKAIMTKENVSFSSFLLAETQDDQISTLPDTVVAEIRKNIRTGAKDLTQKWKNALELVHRAYQVSNVRRPTPAQKSAWQQYEEAIRYGVQQLSTTRGLSGDWRTTSLTVKEGVEDQEVNVDKKHRYFIEIPGEAAIEVMGNDLDSIIESIQNRILRGKEVRGTNVRIEERTKEHVVMTMWVNGVKRERIVIKQIS